MSKIARGASRTTKPAKLESTPPLRNGDRLTVAEFHRRYLAMPHVKKAELIDGVVYMPSPVSFRKHSEPDGGLVMWSGVYKAHTPGVSGGANPTLRVLVGESEPQPDSCLRIEEEYGGRSWVDEEGYLTGSPEWVGEVSFSSVKIDLEKKLPMYEKNGIREFVLWRVPDKAIDWFILKQGKYERLVKSKDSIYKSKVFPGLWLDADAMIAGDLLKVLEVLQKGIASPEHKRFVKKLQAKK